MAASALQNAVAQQQLLAISRKYESSTEFRKSDGSTKHKCFLSYHSDDATEVLAFVEAFDSVFIPKSIGVSDADGSIINSYDQDYIMDRIRSNYLADSTVTIVLVGKCTWARKFVDWEIYSSLRRGTVNKLNGLLGIQLPSAAAISASVPARLQANRPSRDSSTEAYARYWAYPQSALTLQRNIEDAFLARTTRDHLIVNGTLPRRTINSSC